MKENKENSTKRLSIEAQIKELNTQLEAEKIELDGYRTEKVNEEFIENERNIISKIRMPMVIISEVVYL